MLTEIGHELLWSIVQKKTWEVCRLKLKAEITLVEFGGRYCETGCGVSSLETKIEIIIIGLY